MLTGVSIVIQTFYLSSASLLVKSFYIPALTHLKGSRDKHLEKWQPGTRVDLPRLNAILRKKTVQIK